MNIEQDVLEGFKKVAPKGTEISKDSVIKELGLDSLDVVEMLTDMEEKYSVEFDNEEMGNLKTVNDVIVVLTKKVK